MTISNIDQDYSMFVFEAQILLLQLGLCDGLLHRHRERGKIQSQRERDIYASVLPMKPALKVLMEARVNTCSTSTSTAPAGLWL